jgi:transposase
MNADLDALATALYVTIDDAFIADPSLVPDRPVVGTAVQLSDAELLTMAVLQALLGYTNEARWIRYAQTHLGGLFPYIPQRPGYNKRLRNSTTMMSAIIRLLATRCDAWYDDVWLIDSTPVECGRSRETAKRSNAAGYAGYGYCASHTRYFWGLRLHILATPSGLPISFALANAKSDEREIARDLLDIDPMLLAGRRGQTIIADKGYRSKEFETILADYEIDFIRPATKTEPPRPGQRFLKPLRQIIESINQTLKAQLDLERHGGRTSAGIVARVWQRMLALTAAIWHNQNTRQPVLRSLTAYDH